MCPEPERIYSGRFPDRAASDTWHVSFGHAEVMAAVLLANFLLHEPFLLAYPICWGFKHVC